VISLCEVILINTLLEMNQFLTAICFFSLASLGASDEPATTIESDYFTLSISAGAPEGKVITATPTNTPLKKRLSGGQYFLGLRIASNREFMRKGLWLKSDQIYIPLDIEQPPPLLVRLYVEDFEFVEVGVYDDQCFSDGWSFVRYFSVSDDGFTLVDPVKEGLIEPMKAADRVDDAN